MTAKASRVSGRRGCSESAAAFAWTLHQSAQLIRAGMANRYRLSRTALPPSASSAAVAPAPLPSKRLMQTNWMDRQRHALQAYEYLCHVGEALQWIEGSLDEEMQFGVVDMEQGEALQDGVVLARLARRFMGDGAVKSIWTVSMKASKPDVDGIVIVWVKGRSCR